MSECRMHRTARLMSDRIHTLSKKNVDTIFKVLYPKVNAGDAGLTLGIRPKAASPLSSWDPAAADSEKFLYNY